MEQNYDFFVYKSFKDLLESEAKEVFGLSKEECINQINKTIFKTPDGLWIQRV